MNNAVVEFAEQGKSFSSDEGRKLVQDSERSILKDAAKDSEVAGALVIAMNKSTDPYFRRKIILALSD